MDFSVLLQDLRDVAEKYKGKTTEPSVSTIAYVDMFTKVILELMVSHWTHPVLSKVMSGDDEEDEEEELRGHVHSAIH
ncbi:hypothetical protein MAR_012484 [Mya arenaria]|uniref:Uncharacterized protein n=1 Tax=Mya arenaria TaxID=6604 RepID=A0ABY7FX69_MYAAR|nr:hypothetical protein MAR_012484 [Mya arenaria]